MNRPEWVEQFAQAIPQLQAHELSRFVPSEDIDARQSAVLLLFGETERGIDVVLIERSAQLSKHSGQIAFPGGGIDPEDTDEIAAALREATEEVGLLANTVEIIGSLPRLWLPVSNNVVTPVVAWWREPHEIHVADPREVQRVERISIAELVDPQVRVRVRHASGYIGPAFLVRGWTVWGFTGGILDRLLDAFGLATDWDQTRIVDL